MTAVEEVLHARRKSIGPGLVDRVLPALGRRHVGPYILLDDSGPHTQLPGNALAIPPHPHIGLSTLTWLLQGEAVHRDSLGNTQRIRPGEVNWMTAGRGIVHSERAPQDMIDARLVLHALQLWVGLTAEHEDVEPHFQHLEGCALPRMLDAGAQAILIAGAAYGQASPLRTFTPQFFVELRMQPGARFPLPSEHEERAVYVVRGLVMVEERACHPQQLAVLRPGGMPVVRAETDAVVMLLGGAPIATPHMWWNFVSSKPEKIDQAKADWAANRFVLPPDDHAERVPLPASG